MLKRWLVLLLVVALGIPRGAMAADVDTDLASGIRQAQEGDFETAVTTLDSVVRRLTGQPTRAKDLARAYTYLSIAYLGLSQEQTAKAKFLEAWKADREMNLSPREFPPRILEFFDKAREEAGITPAPTPTPRATPVPSRSAPSSSAEPKKGGSKTVPILIGAAVLGGVGAAVALGGGGDDPTSDPTPQPNGPLSFRLTWTTTSDLDLHVREPNGNEIDFVNTTSSTGGSLDRDLVCQSGSETIAWNSNPPRGSYQFWAEFSQSCGAQTSVSYTLTVSRGNSIVQTQTGTLSLGSETTRFGFVN